MIYRLLINSLKIWQKLKYLGRTVTNQNCTDEGIKEQVKLGECLLPFSSVCVCVCVCVFPSRWTVY